MPVAIEQKIAGILPEFQEELNAFLDYLLFRQASSHPKHNTTLRSIICGDYDVNFPFEKNGTTLNKKLKIDNLDVKESKKRPAFMSFRYRLTDEGAKELMSAQSDFEKIDEDMWK